MNGATDGHKCRPKACGSVLTTNPDGSDACAANMALNAICDPAADATVCTDKAATSVAACTNITNFAICV